MHVIKVPPTARLKLIVRVNVKWNADNIRQTSFHIQLQYALELTIHLTPVIRSNILKWIQRVLLYF